MQSLAAHGASNVLVVSDKLGHELRLQGPATFASFMNTLQTVTYVNLADEPLQPATRVIMFVVSDGVVSSQKAFCQLALRYINDPPRLDLGHHPHYSTVFREGEGPVSLVSLNSFSLFDSDSTSLDYAVVTMKNHPDGSD